MARAVKRSSSSPPPPPPAARTRVPPPRPQPAHADHDELDFLPSLSPAPAPVPSLAPKRRQDLGQRDHRTRPTSRDSPRAAATHAGLQTPSASPQGGRVALATGAQPRRRASNGVHAAMRTARDERDMDADGRRDAQDARRASGGLRRGARAQAEAAAADDAVALLDEGDDASPKKRRRSSLNFKPSLSQPEEDTERNRRARQRAEAGERERSRSLSHSASPHKAPRRRAIVLDDEEDDDVGSDVHVKPDPDAAPAVAVDGAPRPGSKLRTRPAGAFTAPSATSVPSPTRASLSPTSASPSNPMHPPAPSVSAFLLGLSLPSLSRLAPLLHGLGLSSAHDLVQLASPVPAAVRARHKVLERVDGMDRATRGEEGGLSAWERIVLEEELDEVWRKWGAAEGGTAA